MLEPSTPDLDKAALAEALEGVLGPIDTEESAFAAIEAVCQALGCRPDAVLLEDPDA